MGERRSSEPPKLWRELLRENRASSEIFGHDLTCLHLTVAIKEYRMVPFLQFFQHCFKGRGVKLMADKVQLCKGLLAKIDVKLAQKMT